MFKLKMIPSLVLFHSLTVVAALAHDLGNNQKSAVYATPATMVITSTQLGFPIISLAYEHSLTNRGLALFIPMHGGYLENSYTKQFAYGLGIGLRRYIGESFSGSYLTAQSDFIKGEDDNNGGHWEYLTPDPATGTNPREVWIDGTQPRKEIYLSMSQVSYGYKWMWKQVALDLSLGGAFYANQDEKFTGFIGAANIGIPFGKETFGF